MLVEDEIFYLIPAKVDLSNQGKLLEVFGGTIMGR